LVVLYHNQRRSIAFPSCAATVVTTKVIQQQQDTTAANKNLPLNIIFQLIFSEKPRRSVYPSFSHQSILLILRVVKLVRWEDRREKKQTVRVACVGRQQRFEFSTKAIPWACNNLNAWCSRRPSDRRCLLRNRILGFHEPRRSYLLRNGLQLCPF